MSRNLKAELTEALKTAGNPPEGPWSDLLETALRAVSPELARQMEAEGTLTLWSRLGRAAAVAEMDAMVEAGTPVNLAQQAAKELMLEDLRALEQATETQRDQREQELELAKVLLDPLILRLSRSRGTSSSPTQTPSP